ncbi:hypothetical protein MES4922_230172 [Mesorhizobium ventifaucium]|uniref:Uncharacterized protein n=1 Tax=Mesorhizobium ventifaucium TaxID=666020 RepID=A0ABM9DTY2_9HYPH|nr:hypothetical protein MES4922_230172 [Mesorhizobium ventifaucium]
MALAPVRSGQFRPDVKHAEKGGKDLGKLRELLGLLLAGGELPRSVQRPRQAVLSARRL